MIRNPVPPDVWAALLLHQADGRCAMTDANRLYTSALFLRLFRA